MATYTLMFADALFIQGDEFDQTNEEIVASRLMLIPSRIDIQACDASGIDFIVHFSFEVDGPAELRSEVERIIESCGRDVEVFSVMNEAGNVVLTEEEFWASNTA